MLHRPKVSSLFLLSLILLSFSVSSTACAIKEEVEDIDVEETTGVDVKDELLKAKELFNISDKFTQVDAQEDNGCIYIHWSMEDEETDTHENISVQFNEKEDIVDYYYYLEEEDYIKANVSMKEIKQAAIDWTQKILSISKDEVNIHEVETKGSNYELVLNLYKEGYPVYGGTIYMSFNRDSGELVEYHLSETAQKVLHSKLSFKDKKIQEKEALKSYFRKNKMVPILYRDYSQEKYLPYYEQETLNGLIDARTGKLIKAFDYEEYLSVKESADTAMAEEQVGGNLTPVEEKELDKLKNIQSKDKALDKVMGIFGLKPNTLVQDRIFKDPEEEEHYYAFDYEQNNSRSSVNIRGKDLLPKSYYNYDDETRDQKITEKMAESFYKDSQSFMEKYLPFSDEYVPYEKMDYDKTHSYMQYYLRKIGNYLVSDDNIYFHYSPNGLVEYTLNRNFSEIDYTKAKITRKKAEKALLKEYHFDTYIVPMFDSSGNIKELRLAYGIDVNRGIINGLDGKKKLDNYSLSLFKPTGKQNGKINLADLEAYNFGVAEAKTLKDPLNYKDLLYNLAIYDQSGYCSEEKLTNQYKDYGLFKEDKLEDPVTLEALCQVAVLNKLNLKDGDLQDHVFKNIGKHPSNGKQAYSALAYNFNWIDQQADMQEELTVEEGAEYLYQILFD